MQYKLMFHHSVIFESSEVRQNSRCSDDGYKSLLWISSWISVGMCSGIFQGKKREAA